MQWAKDVKKLSSGTLRTKKIHLRKIVKLLTKELNLAEEPKIETVGKYFTPENIAVVSACLGTENQARLRMYLSSWRWAVHVPCPLP